MVQALARKGTDLKAGRCFHTDAVTEELNHEWTEETQWHGQVQGARQWDDLALCQEVKMTLLLLSEGIQTSLSLNCRYMDLIDGPLGG